MSFVESLEDAVLETEKASFVVEAGEMAMDSQISLGFDLLGYLDFDYLFVAHLFVDSAEAVVVAAVVDESLQFVVECFAAVGRVLVVDSESVFDNLELELECSCGSLASSSEVSAVATFGFECFDYAVALCVVALGWCEFVVAAALVVVATFDSAFVVEVKWQLGDVGETGFVVVGALMVATAGTVEFAVVG